MKKEEIIRELVNSAERIGVTTTLYAVFGRRVNVTIAFTQRAYDMNIDELEFSVRAGNALKRSGLFTVGDIVDVIADGELMQIRNLGKKTQNEIKTRILELGYEKLTEIEKRQFFDDMLTKNYV